MRVVSTALLLLVVGSGAPLAQRQETARAYPVQASYRPYGFGVFTDWQPANVRIDVSPGDAQVFVDAINYVGVASQFGGAFKHLTLHAGPHVIEFRKTGFRSLAVELNLYADQHVTLLRTLQPSRGNEAADTGAEATAPAFEEGAFLPAAQGPSGGLRFDVQPKDAEIYADGFYVGIVDDFNGSQHMMLTRGQHHVVLKREGHETLDLNLSIDSERTVTYRATIKKLAARP